MRRFIKRLLQYMKKIDIIQEGMKTKKVEYDVYCKLKGTNLYSIYASNFIHMALLFNVCNEIL